MSTALNSDIHTICKVCLKEGSLSNTQNVHYEEVKDK